jgi:hypothetical protein
METKLVRKGTDPATNPTQTVSLWVQDTTLNIFHIKILIGRNERNETKRAYATNEEADAALKTEIERWTAEGFAPQVAAAAPSAAPTPSKAKPVTRPRWLDAPQEGLEKLIKKLQSSVKKAGLAHRSEEILAASRLGVDLTPKKAKPADLREVVSRIGGDPDLPASQAWPTHAGAPLSFLAQFLVADFAAYDLEGVLPKDGLLSVFAQLDSAKPDYGSACSVLHFGDSTDKLVRTPPLNGGQALSTAFLLSAKLRLTVPPSEDPSIEALGLTQSEQAHYHDDLFLGHIPEGRNHTLLGHGTAANRHSMKGKRFFAQIDSDRRISFQMGSFNTLRFYFDGDRLDDKALRSMVCTLEEA